MVRLKWVLRLDDIKVHIPVELSMPIPPNITLNLATASAVLGKLYCEAWRIYWHALGSATNN